MLVSVLPRSFSSLLFILISSPILCSYVGLLLPLPISIIWHFLVLNSNFHFQLHFQILSISFCNSIQSRMFLITLKSFASSEKKKKKKIM
ncbi:hypothetical protein E2C01_016504 [Portunus trituberculatus]|uniref:Uncharacterized protein n=1 Tax=Portunus trituberculatus TaxID=210409 RepID=A0A5B7DQF5_PORTR|nr:hypothetical protein [Portunus trituberculatus]